MSKKEIRINAFHMNTPAHSWAGLWKHPRDRSSDYTSLDYWVDLAQTAERGLLDGVFLADVFGVYDVYGGDHRAALERGAQSPINDPMLVVPAMAHATRHLGFGVTANLTYEHPYQFARRLSTLDHLTGGRVGWNIVTGYLQSAARGMGWADVREHDKRYDAADDFLEAAYKLWEGSWQADAVRRDRAAGVYTDPDRVHRVVHDGPYYKVDGIHLSEPSPQRTPVLYQAGASARGKQFAGRHAECIYLSGQTQDIIAGAARDIREAAVAEGRRPEDILMFLNTSIVVAATRKEAQALHREYAQYVDQQGQLALISGWTGIDFSGHDLDEAIRYAKTNGMQTQIENITVRSKHAITVRDQISFNGIGARGPFLVGSAEDVADGLIDWVDKTGIDGFNLTRMVVPESLASFVDLVVPELQARGRYKQAYSPGTLREKLFGGEGPLLAERHVGARYRHASQPAHGLTEERLA